MTIVTVSEKFTEILASFGDLQESVNAALQRYTIDQITTKPSVTLMMRHSSPVV